MPELIPVITLWQPWASLIFSGDKLHETRSYRPPLKYLGERIAIHAAVRPPRGIPESLDFICTARFGEDWRDKLPRGSLLGTVKLVAAWSTENPRRQPSRIDRDCGDWTAGRYAWELRNPRLLSDPLTATGKQGWWHVDRRLVGIEGDPS